MLYPQQNDLRNRLDLSGYWDFQLDPDENGESAGWFNGLAAPRAIAVPASWNEQFEDTRDYMGVAWYCQSSYLPSSWQGERVFLRVGSANYAAKVWVNGELVGTHEGGHLPFTVDIGAVVRWGEPNLVAIQVDNKLLPTRVPAGGLRGDGPGAFMDNHPDTTFDFFPYGGLHRAVYLYSVPQTHLGDVTVVTDVEGLDSAAPTGLVQLTLQVTDGYNGAGQAQLRSGDQVWSTDVTFTNGQATALLRVPNPRLWGPDDPHLYSLTVTLNQQGKVVDRYQLAIGIRTVAVEGDQLLLNGNPIFLKGFGKHEDFPIHGRGINLPLTIRDNSLLRWLGANSYRTAHYPYAEEAMLLADREGLLIIDEIPAVSLQFGDGDANIQARLDQCKAQLRELVARDKNHPSVIMWSVANEPMPANFMRRMMGAPVNPADDAVGTVFFRELFDLVHELDATRPATLVGVMNGPVEWLQLADVALINRYWGWYTQGGRLEQGRAGLENELDTLHAALGKPIVISEFGADTVAGMHSNPPEMFTEEYQVEFLRVYLEVAAARPFVAGLHVWNFADFKTSQGIMRVGGLNHKGVFTRDRRPKMAAHFLREQWQSASQREDVR
ncbi:MAG: beta-glucuronidase [Caldilineaceae bacterium]